MIIRVLPKILPNHQKSIELYILCGNFHEAKAFANVIEMQFHFRQEKIELPEDLVRMYSGLLRFSKMRNYK